MNSIVHSRRNSAGCTPHTCGGTRHVGQGLSGAWKHRWRRRTAHLKLTFKSGRQVEWKLEWDGKMLWWDVVGHRGEASNPAWGWQGGPQRRDGFTCRILKDELRSTRQSGNRAKSRLPGGEDRRGEDGEEKNSEDGRSSVFFSGVWWEKYIFGLPFPAQRHRALKTLGIF